MGNVCVWTTNFASKNGFDVVCLPFTPALPVMIQNVVHNSFVARTVHTNPILINPY